MRNMKRIVMIIMAVALVALPTMAQSFGSKRSVENDQQAAQNYTTEPFRSTSALQGSGSTYSANPSLNSDGTVYNPSESSTPAGGGPRRLGGLPGSGGSGSDGMPDTSKTPDNTPIGDAVLPLMLMALAYLGMRVFRARKRA